MKELLCENGDVFLKKGVFRQEKVTYIHVIY